MTLRVGLVVYGGLDRLSGGYLYDRELVDHLRDRGDEVEVIGLPDGPYPRRLAANLDAVGRLRGGLGSVDVLLQDELCHPSLVLANRAVDPDPPVVAVVHHLTASEPRGRVRSGWHRALERRYLRTVDAAVCNSTATRASLPDALPTVVAPPGGDRFDASVTPAAVADRAEADPFRIAFLGNVEPRKGLDTLLRGLGRADADAELTVMGSPVDPGYGRRLRRLARSVGIAEEVRFAGRVSDGTAARTLRRTHLFGMPSRYEGFGMAYLEAMAFGAVPLASTAGGASDLVTHGETGVLVDPGDAAAVAGWIDRLDSDRARLSELGRAALARADAHPTWAESMERVRRFLRRTVDRGGGGASATADVDRRGATPGGDGP